MCEKQYVFNDKFFQFFSDESTRYYFLIIGMCPMQAQKPSLWAFWLHCREEFKFGEN